MQFSANRNQAIAKVTAVSTRVSEQRPGCELRYLGLSSNCPNPTQPSPASHTPESDLC